MQEIAEIGRLLCYILPILQMVKNSRNRDNQESSLCPGHTNRGYPSMEEDMCYPLNYLGSALWERRYQLYKSIPGKHHMGLGICKIVCVGKTWPKLFMVFILCFPQQSFRLRYGVLFWLCPCQFGKLLIFYLLQSLDFYTGMNNCTSLIGYKKA